MTVNCKYSELEFDMISFSFCGIMDVLKSDGAFFYLISEE